MKITVSRKAYKTPDRAAKAKATADIQLEMRESPQVLDLSAAELAEYIKRGHCVRGAVLAPQSPENTTTGRNGKPHFNTEKAFQYQSVIMLDFDNKTDPPRPELGAADGVRDFVNSRLGADVVTIVNESSTSSEQLRKWHVLLALKEPCTDFRRVRAVLRKLANDTFAGVADANCTDPARLALGTTPEKTVKVYDGRLDINSIALPEPKQRQKPKPKSGRDTGSGGMSPKRLAEIILNARCDFGADGYNMYWSTCCALYHVAGIPSADIAKWAASYDGTEQSPEKWENSEPESFTVGTLIKAAKQLDPQGFEEYRQECTPAWLDGSTIDERRFCEWFIEQQGEFRCINDKLYTIDGEAKDEYVKSTILENIKYYCKSGLARKADNILKCLKLITYSDPLPPDPYKIHVKNGTITLTPDGEYSFSPVKEFCTCRLNVEYTDNITRANVWRDFLADLLEPQDVLTLQEFMGYCLIPSTRAQKMLLLVGAGGEGKSQIGVVMQEIFGAGLVNGELKDLDNGSKARFAREKLVERLVMLDDDTDLAALGGTSFLKQLVTAQIPLEVEPKGRPSFQTLLYSRVLAFGNGAISSLYDNSDGFYRRQIILKVKPRPADRTDDRAISEKFIAEKQQIFMWALLGLSRLMRKGFEFTQSEQARQNLEQAKRDSCNIFAFMESDGYFKRDPQGNITSKDFYALYVDWCEDNNEKPRTDNSFKQHVNTHAKALRVERSENIRTPDGRRVRGYKGIVSCRVPTDPRVFP